MKYFSEKLKKVYDTVEDLETAEKEFDEKHEKELALKEERKQRAQEVEDAYKKYLDLRANFIKDYKSYHMTLTEKDLPNTTGLSLFDLFDSFWF